MTRYSHRSLVLFALAFLCIFWLSPSVRADDAPGWLRQTASVNLPAYDKDIPAVVLFEEKSVTLNSDGKMVTSINSAVKVLTREGKDFAIARAFYYASFSKVKEMSAWLIRPDGTSKSYDKKAILDIIANTNDVYNEGRLKVIDGSGDADNGYVFGYSVVTEEPPLFYQDEWSFQGPIPAMVSRYSVNLPSGWTANSMTFNAAEIIPRVNGSSYTWEMRDQPRIAKEPLSPARENIAARIVVNYVPDRPDKAVNRVFANWVDVSRWATQLYEPQAIVDDAVAAKARELTSGATTELEKIRAIGHYVQNLQYIAIDIGVGYGNGMIPRPSTTVLSRGYGDCKDKANLMRALLRSLKIDAYPIIIYSGDPTLVREQWPSPMQFNHCIIAVKISDSTQGPTVVNYEKLGRLLIFDATDPYTSVGDLPEHLQGSQALIIAGESGGLIRMPVTPPDTDVLERTVEANLNNLGEIKGKISELARGQQSTAARAAFRLLSAADYRKMIEGWVTRGATGAMVDDLKSTDGADGFSFNLDVAFSAARYAQLMQGRLLVFKPVIVDRRNSVYLTENKRTNPVEMGALSFREKAVFTLPDGFDIEEIPTGVNIESSFGKYTSKYEVKANKLHFSRSLTLTRAMLPVDKYTSTREFFTKVRDAEQSQVVLVRK